MRIIFTILFTVIVCGITYSQGQPPQQVNTNYQMKSLGSDSGVLRIPIFTVLPTAPQSNYVRQGGLVARRDSTLWSWDSAAGKFQSVPMKVLESLQTDSSQVRFFDTTIAVATGTSKTPLKTIQKKTSGYFTQWVPFNFGKSYVSGHRPGTGVIHPGKVSTGYSSEESLDAMPDNVYQIFGYNEDPSSNRADTADAAIRVAMETNFLNTLGDGTVLNFEYHNPEVIPFNAPRVRVRSDYISKMTGYTFEQNFIDATEYRSVFNNTPYFQFQNTNQALISPFMAMIGDPTNATTCTIMLESTDHAHDMWIGNLQGTLQLGLFDFGQMNLLHNGNISLNQSITLDPATWHSTKIGMDSIGNMNADPSSILECSSVHKGFLPPRMTTLQKLAIPSPAEGLQVYDLTLHQMSYFNGTTWINF